MQDPYIFEIISELFPGIAKEVLKIIKSKKCEKIIKPLLVKLEQYSGLMNSFPEREEQYLNLINATLQAIIRVSDTIICN